MTPERWRKLKDLFHGALDLPPGQREQWLAEQAGPEKTLVSEALALLHAHDEGESPLDTPPHPADRETFPRGTELGPFRIEGELGRGGMGVVYKAFDERLGHTVALKVLSGAAASDPVRRKRLQNEAVLAATINHPGVASVYRLEQIDGALLLATEFVAGHTLRAETEGGPLGLQRALTLTRHVLEALAAAHAAGVVHRDLKPDNIMVTPHGDVKLVDFGIARSDRFAMTRVTRGGAPGTPAYMAPEQLAGATADGRADIYAVGVILAELVSGQHPGVPAQTPLPSQLQAIVDRALERDPAARFQSAGDMLQAIDALQRPRSHADSVALSWWRFHECTAAVTYWLMLIPAWTARGVIGGSGGRVLFLAILAAVVVSSILRLHLCFTSYYYERHLMSMRSQAGIAIRLSDVGFVMGLAGAALALGDGHSALTVLLLSVAVGAGVAALVVEPATTRAAFDH